MIKEILKSAKHSHYLQIPAYYPIPDGCGHWLSQDELVYYSAYFDHEFVIPAHSLNDLASIPRFFRRVFNVNGQTRLASIPHDDLYAKAGLNNGKVFSREQCDAVMLEQMLMDRDNVYQAYSQSVRRSLKTAKIDKAFTTGTQVVSDIEACLVHAAVRIGGGSHWPYMKHIDELINKLHS